MDEKDWIRERADKIADEEFGSDFYDLSGTLQDKIYSRAMAGYTDYYADYCDSVFERIKGAM